jgi:hypothetical protein
LPNPSFGGAAIAEATQQSAGFQGVTELTVPINQRTIDIVLRIGDYETGLRSEDLNSDDWKGVTGQVVKDVTAWVAANRSIIERRSIL